MRIRECERERTSYHAWDPARPIMHIAEEDKKDVKNGARELSFTSGEEEILARSWLRSASLKKQLNPIKLNILL